MDGLERLMYAALADALTIEDPEAAKLALALRFQDWQARARQHNPDAWQLWFNALMRASSADAYLALGIDPGDGSQLFDVAERDPQARALLEQYAAALADYVEQTGDHMPVIERTDS